MLHDLGEGGGVENPLLALTGCPYTSLVPNSDEEIPDCRPVQCCLAESTRFSPNQYLALNSSIFA